MTTNQTPAAQASGCPAKALEDADWVITLEQQTRAVDRIRALERAVEDLIEAGDGLVACAPCAVEGWRRAARVATELTGGVTGGGCNP